LPKAADTKSVALVRNSIYSGEAHREQSIHSEM
jgi:hypothetical protein